MVRVIEIEQRNQNVDIEKCPLQSTFSFAKPVDHLIRNDRTSASEEMKAQAKPQNAFERRRRHSLNALTVPIY
jgi:hypothetical protein